MCVLEQARVYGEVFQKVDLSPVDFLRLVDLGERREVSEGELLSKAGRMQEDVFLIVSGTAEVRQFFFFLDSAEDSTSPMMFIS